MSEYYNPGVQQLYPDTCAIKSQQLILKDFGIDVTETELVQAASANGWYNAGTAPQDVGNLLNLAGIPITKQTHANVFNLVNELAQGHEVIVGVDADELWHNNTFSEKFSNWVNDALGEQGGNHALIVAGIDTRDPNNIQVIVKDPGNGDDGKPYPLCQFMDAWADTQCLMVATDVAAPKDVKGMELFDYQTGHLETVAGVDYAQFCVFNELSNELPAPFVNVNGETTYNSALSSLVEAYFDVANNDIALWQIGASAPYAFNAYVSYNEVQAAFSHLLCADFENPCVQSAWVGSDEINADVLNGMGVTENVAFTHQPDIIPCDLATDASVFDSSSESDVANNLYEHPFNTDLLP